MNAHAEPTLDEKRALAVSPENHDVATRLALVVGRLNRRIRPRQDGLSHGLMSALSTVVKATQMRPGELAASEEVAPPTMTRTIAELENRGLIERLPDKHDRRSCFISPTKKGIDAILGANFERAEYIQAMIDTLTDAEAKRLAAALAVLEKIADLHPASGARN